MANGRCRMHGGASTGPKTAEGKARIAAAQARRGDPVHRTILARAAAIQRCGRVLVATVDGGVALGALAAPLCAVLGLTEKPPGDKAGAAAFVQAHLMTCDLTAAGTRALMGAIREIAGQQSMRRERCGGRRVPSCSLAPTCGAPARGTPGLSGQRPDRADPDTPAAGQSFDRPAVDAAQRGDRQRGLPGEPRPAVGAERGGACLLYTSPSPRD